MGMMKRLATEIAEQAARREDRFDQQGLFEEMMRAFLEDDRQFAEKHGPAGGLLEDTLFGYGEVTCSHCDKKAIAWIHDADGLRFVCPPHHKEVA